MGFECYPVGWERRKDTLPMGWGLETNIELGEKAQEFVRVNVAESAHGDTSSVLLGGREIFGLKKIDS